MSIVIVLPLESGYEMYCAECKRWYPLGLHPDLAALLIASHDQGHEEAAAVAEAERIIQEGARA